MNLGHFSWRGPFTFVNLTVDLANTQIQLALRSTALLNIEPGFDLLDVACGRGKTSYMMRRMHQDVTVSAVDLLPENIRIAEALFGNIDNLSYQVGDAAELPFEDASFNGVHCLEAAFHFPHRDRFLHEAGRVLRSGGRLVVVDFVWRQPEYRKFRDSDDGRIVRDVWQWDDLYTLNDYVQAADEAGMSLVENRNWSPYVTTPMQGMMDWFTWLGARPWGRRLMCRVNPLLNGMSGADWEELAISCAAHRNMGRYTRYEAMVFEKR